MKQKTKKVALDDEAISRKQKHLLSYEIQLESLETAIDMMKGKYETKEPMANLKRTISDAEQTIKIAKRQMETEFPMKELKSKIQETEDRIVNAKANIKVLTTQINTRFEEVVDSNGENNGQ